MERKLTVWFENSTVFAISTSHPNSCKGKLAALFPKKMSQVGEFAVKRKKRSGWNERAVDFDSPT